MNCITIKNAEITKTWEATTPRGPVMNMILRDITGSHAVYFQTAFWGQEAVIAKQNLKEGDLICLTGSMWIKTQQMQTGKESFIVMLEKPTNVHKLSDTYINLAGDVFDRPVKPDTEEHNGSYAYTAEGRRWPGENMPCSREKITQSVRETYKNGDASPVHLEAKIAQTTRSRPLSERK